MKSFRMDMLEEGAVRIHFVLSDKVSYLRQLLDRACGQERIPDPFEM
ncbi:hypothetical protein [Paenibacillus sp. RC67]|nr:hypothetical protein [Paenibacillus sp. RC67]